MKNQIQPFINVCLFVLLLLNINISAQTSVGIYNYTIAVIPNYTLVSGSNFSVTGSVINTGNTSITNNVHVNLGIDTSSTTTLKYVWRSTTTYSVTNLLPNSTFTFNVTDMGDPANGYKTNGNGTTIIIWPIIASITNTASVSDTAKAIIFITLPNTLNDVKAFENSVLILQNPAKGMLNVKCSILNEPLLIELRDANGALLLKENISSLNNSQYFTFNIQHFPLGIYYLSFDNKNSHKTITKKIIIN